MEQQLIEWATNESSIRAMILTGSRAKKQPADSLSDYDLSIFCTSYDAYIKSDQWLSSIGNVWVYIPQTLKQCGQVFPTRLVIFEGGINVDFDFFSLDLLSQLSKSSSLPEEYNYGYKVLVDKDQLTSNLPQPNFEKTQEKPPTEEEFIALINEFWFEIYQIAKYLKREDLWVVKFRSGWIHDHLLLRLIEWNQQSKNNWSLNTRAVGKNMQFWIDPSIWSALHTIFPHFDAKESRTHLFKLIDLFRRLAKETANRLIFNYPEKLDKNMSTFVLGLLR